MTNRAGPDRLAALVSHSRRPGGLLSDVFACRRVRSSRNAVHTSYLSRQPEITPDMRGILFEWPVCSPAKPF